MSVNKIDKIIVDFLSNYYVAGGGIIDMHKRIDNIEFIEKGEFTDIDVAIDVETKFLLDRFLFVYESVIIINDKSISNSEYYLTEINELNFFASKIMGHGGIFYGSDVIVLPVFPIDGCFFFFQHDGYFFKYRSREPGRLG